MPTLTPEHKAFVVTSLARYDAPGSVRDALRETYGVDASLAQLAAYDPGNAAARNLSDKWRRLFDETRAAFLAAVAGVPAAHKAVRVHRLSQWADRAARMGNTVHAAALYEQIAKEMGQAYTNVRLHELSGRGGGPVPFTRIVLERAEPPGDD